MNSTPIPQTGTHFAVTHLGSFSNLHQFTFEATEHPLKVEGKVFLKDRLQLTGAEVSINSLPPKKSLPFYHKHQQNEEIYLFLSGQGEFQVDGTIFSVAEGSAVRVDPNGERCLRNCSSTDELRWVVIQARAGSQTAQDIQDGYGVPKRVSWRQQATQS